MTGIFEIGFPPLSHTEAERVETPPPGGKLIGLAVSTIPPTFDSLTTTTTDEESVSPLSLAVTVEVSVVVRESLAVPDDSVAISFPPEASVPLVAENTTLTPERGMELAPVTVAAICEVPPSTGSRFGSAVMERLSAEKPMVI
jgi:hypothetical protein